MAKLGEEGSNITGNVLLLLALAAAARAILYAVEHSSLNAMWTACSDKFLFWGMLLSVVSSIGSRTFLIDLREKAIVVCTIYFAYGVVHTVVTLPYRKDAPVEF